MGRKILLAVLILVVLYLGTGLAFHFKWENELAACREMRAARGEFVEPPVFSSFIRLSFQVTWWPFYVRANIYHDGTPFATPCTHSGIAVISTEEEEGAVRYAIESFGKRLQNVPLQSPEAAEVLQVQYLEFVSEALLETWTMNPSSAPGRMVSSPWPDYIEITTLVKEGPGRYTAAGFIVMVTSMDKANGSATDKIPVRIAVENQEGRWLITEYTED